MIGERKRTPDDVNWAQFLALTVQIECVQQAFVEHIESNCARLLGIAKQHVDVMNLSPDW